MKNSFERWAGSLVSVFVPKVCAVCGTALVSGEEVMCLHCLADLPRPVRNDFNDNEMHDRLVSLKAPVEKAATFFYYHKDNPYARLIHETKYHSRPSIGRRLAAMRAAELRREGFFDGIDAIVPTPLHWMKKLKRGYNQSHEISLGISGTAGLPVIQCLKSRWHTTQTRKDMRGRRQNAVDAFRGVAGSVPQGNAHLLVVDDVLTTGSTMLAALEAIREVNPRIRLSVFTLVITHLS